MPRLVKAKKVISDTEKNAILKEIGGDELVNHVNKNDSFLVAKFNRNDNKTKIEKVDYKTKFMLWTQFNKNGKIKPITKKIKKEAKYILEQKQTPTTQYLKIENNVLPLSKVKILYNAIVVINIEIFVSDDISFRTPKFNIGALPKSKMVKVSYGYNHVNIPFENKTDRAIKLTESMKQRILNACIELYNKGNNFEKLNATVNQMVFYSDEVKPENKINISNMALGATQYSLFVDNVDYIKSSDGDCALVYLKKSIKNKKVLERLNIFIKDNNIDKELTTQQIHKFCVENDISMRAYDINGSVIIKNEFSTKNSGNNGCLSFIAYDGHIYPLKDKILKKSSEYKDVVFCDSHLEFTKLLNDKKIIDHSNCNFIFSSKEKDGLYCERYIYNAILYVDNTEFNKIAYEILKKKSLISEMINCTTPESIFKLFEKCYNTEKVNLDSFAPSLKTEKPYYYVNNEIKYTVEEVYTYDQNLSYTSALHSLDFLIVGDEATDLIEKVNIPFKKIDAVSIKSEYVYNVNVVNNTIILPYSGRYSGCQLLKALKYGVKFDIIEIWHTKAVPNIYKKMIPDLINICDELKVSRDIIKMIFNKTFGIFEQINKHSMPIYQNVGITKDCNYSLSDSTQSFGIKDTTHYLQMNIVNKAILYNRAFIKMQITQQSRNATFDFMTKNNIKPCDVIQSKVDSISIKNFIEPKNFKVEPKNSLKLGMWKKETKFSKLNINDDFDNELVSFVDKNLYNDSRYTNLYAGGGKTTYIINKLIPSLNNDYFVYTPTHKALSEYHKSGIKNCHVIQSISYSHTIPEQNNIIIDEHGMLTCDDWKMMHILSLEGKNIYSFGDDRQLPPIEKIPTNKEYINALFKERTDEFKNWRNNFTKQYYDDLLAGKYNIDHVLKYNTAKWFDAEIMISFTNDTRKKCNEMMLKKLGLTKFDIGAKLICTTNNLIKYDLYNNMDLVVKKYEDDNVVFDNDIKINKKYLNNTNFDSGYCLTLHKLQGQSVKSFCYMIDNISDKRFIEKPVSQYVLISRLKQELNI